MTACFLISDLHGDTARYETLFEVLRTDPPSAVFLAGDLLPSALKATSGAAQPPGDFVRNFLVPALARVRECLGERYPRVFLVLGNDDGRAEEQVVIDEARSGLWEYVHGRRVTLGSHDVYGYAFVPPTPFLLKDWERYDVSRYVDPGCVAPDEGWHTIDTPGEDPRTATIQRDLADLTGSSDLTNAVFLFHAPPYDTLLDRAALDGKLVDHAPLDVHVGSITIRRLIEVRQPLVTLHGHVHESARLTGAWRDRIGRTHCLSAAHDGSELALVRFDLEDPERAVRELIAPDRASSPGAAGAPGP